MMQAASHSTVDGLVLTRLLSIARLTPAQAVALGADVLARLADPHAGGRPGPDTVAGTGGVDAVRVGRDGRAGLIDADGPPSTYRAAGETLAFAAVLLDRIREAIQPSPADERLVAALDWAAAEARSPDGRVATVAAILRTADATDGAQARAEIARLVAMLAGETEPASIPTRLASHVPLPRLPRRRQRRVVVARVGKWVLSLMVLAALILVEVAFLRDEISRDVQAVLEAGRSGPTETTTPTLPPVVPPAPGAAGTISSIDLRLVDPCTPDAPCSLRMHVLLQPLAEPQTLKWDFRVLDRCTGSVVTAPGGTITVPAQGDRADVVSTIELPQADALAVLAVTSQPFTAASRAVYVPATSACES